MSALCPASSAFTLVDSNLADQPVKPSPDGRFHLLLQRHVDIQLDFNCVFEGQADLYPRWETAIWRTSTSDFCGSCELCSLVQEGLHQRLKSTISNWLRRDKSPSPVVQDVQVRVALKILEYLKEHIGWAIDQSLVETGEVFLVVLKGHADVEQGDVNLNRIDVAVPFELFAEEGNPAAKHLNIHRRPLDALAFSEANVRKIQGWLKDCDKNHVKCREDSIQSSKLAPAPERHILPTRLINVGDPTAAQHPRLVTTSDSSEFASHTQENVKYIALSYCWPSPEGSETTLMTTRETLGDRLHNIPIDTMPQAFKDAVTVAHRLQIKYIWIDSLCIIQRDFHDWQTESAKMAEIYSNAYLTVIAASGASCHDSFLHRSKRHSYCTIPFKDAKYSSTAAYYSLRHRPGDHWWSTDKMAEISGCRWITRGWTFQEERLARRALTFGENKFFFDCRSGERAEDTEMWRLRPKWSETMNEMFDVEVPKPVEGPPLRKLPTLFDHWQTLCNHYSYRELTYPDDKLPALSGMASKIAKRVKSDYLAGLWRNHLTHDLFWQLVGPVRKPTKYRSPSWSWAAVDAEVHWKSWRFCLQCKMYCTIQDAQTTIAGLDPFGTVKDGWLKIFGAVVEVHLLRAVNNQPSRHPWRACLEGEEIARADLDVKKNHPLTDSTEKAWALLVAECIGQRKSPPRGLLLHKTGQKRDGLDEFQRIGIFRVYQSDALHAWENPARQQLIIIT